MYQTRFRACRAILRLWLQQRRIDSLQPYECRWGPVWEHGRSYPMHYHIGHGYYTVPDRVSYQCRHLVVYPWRRLKSRLRLIIRARDIRARKPQQRRKRKDERARA
jgi:hypothetical protein